MEGAPAKPALLALLLAVSLSVSSAVTVLEDTCSSVAASRPRIGYDFCVASLQAGDPDCRAADRRGLAVVAARLSLSRAAGASAEIARMAAGERDPPRRECLGACAEVYGQASDHLNRAVRELRAGRYREAVTFLSAAVDASENCEDAFREVVSGGVSGSPLVEQDKEYFMVTAMALAITVTL
ncbi:putative invertase inhibitor [Zingiber officinale]|uniref:Pectinesterase inhibitor domain-containing protein n=1 Tax=Zingiber officinale TaxID=94328 RepID=A0A8J5HXZ1_ZINOF|nr:putative invertase inhibitor [Zingiber officinale]KAG6522351.1 hypothetical protein ZIOFF_019490 [Zingiber officinale]